MVPSNNLPVVVPDSQLILQIKPTNQHYMSVKFTIKNTAAKATREGDSFVRFSGTSEPFSRHCERTARAIETDQQGNPTKWLFTTGLEEDKVEFYNWYNTEEKEVVKASIAELKPLIERYYGGGNAIHAENYSFWKRDREVNRLKVTHDSVDVFFDTEKPTHALLYLSIIGGAFSDLVAPTKEWAERYQIPHYLALEVDNNNFEDEEDITRSDAHGELANIRKEFGKDALYILAWCIQYDTNAFGAYNNSTPEKDLISYHIKYIDGKLQTKKKKNCPKVFLDYAELWRGQQTKPLLYTEAYVKAGEYFNFINQREKKYVTSDGTILGNTVKEAVTNLMKPKFNVDYEKLRDLVEAKWKE
jgi:hypothetical protein